MMTMTYAWLRLALYSTHENTEIKKNFLGEDNMEYTKNINLHVSSVLHFRVVKEMSSAHCERSKLR